jgi:TRAP-type C4-dicarboxylate transport system permease small subunit
MAVTVGYFCSDSLAHLAEYIRMSQGMRCQMFVLAQVVGGGPHLGCHAEVLINIMPHSIQSSGAERVRCLYLLCVLVLLWTSETVVTQHAVTVCVGKLQVSPRLSIRFSDPHSLELPAEFVSLLFHPFIHCSFLLCLYLVLRLIASRRGCIPGA